MSLTIAIIGRPNVGKSTLFNRLVGKRLAIVDDAPGATRDRREGQGRIFDIEFSLIDTAGLEEAPSQTLESQMQNQTSLALEDANVALMLIDSRVGVTPLDKHFGNWIRQQGIPLILIANKCEGKAQTIGLTEAYSLGLGDPIPFSAEHGKGLSELYDALVPYFKKKENYKDFKNIQGMSQTTNKTKKEIIKPISITIVGRPNVGKSTLVNHLLGEERVLTGPVAGTTRDSINISWQFNGQEIKLVDTAGLRRKSKIYKKIESLSTNDTMRAIKFAQVVVLILDAQEKFEKQDLTIARRIISEGRALLIAVNKWDLIKNPREILRDFNNRLAKSLPQARGVPIITLSAKTGSNTKKLLPAVLNIYEIWNKRISTGALNRWLDIKTTNHPPPLHGGRRIKLRYITQAKNRPPTFVIFSNLSNELPISYSRYLVNSLREDFELLGTPIRLHTKKGENPYLKKK